MVFTGMALAMLAVSIVGFAPAIVNPAGRRGPISLLAAAHGILFFVWLLLFLVQSLLVAVRRVSWHRRLGVASAFVLATMVPLGYAATVAMVRRGFDLSGDQQIEPTPRAGFLDPFTGSIFNFSSLFIFTVLAVLAICYRRRPAMHKRLMLFANLQLVLASIAHFLGHIKLLTGGMVPAFFALFLLAAVGRDYMVDRRVHALTATLAIGFFVLGPVQAVLIGPSPVWHHFVGWLIR